jgi:ATP-dependent RNA helicase DDX19/DBP5
MDSKDRKKEENSDSNKKEVGKTKDKSENIEEKKESSKDLKNVEKKESPKNEEKKEETIEETKNNQEEKRPQESKTKRDSYEFPVKVDEKLGIKNMVDDSFILSPVKRWDELGVRPEIHKGLLEMDFISPSKIQSTTFPLIMKEPRSNIVAQAKNGSGKTCAFGLGVISSIDELSKNIQAVVFAHTRELVKQIEDVLSKIAKFTKVKVTALLSGENEPKEYGQIIVITPGHFDNCFLKRNKSLINNLKMMVLDEADFMLTNEVTSRVFDRTFKLFQKTKMNVQVLFFSATFDVKCFKFIKRFYSNAYMIELKKEELTLDNVSQMYEVCKTPDDKVTFIEEYLKISQGSQRVIIFANKRDYVFKLQQNLLKRGYKVFILMGGDMALSNRDETIKKFSKGEIQILITTDLLSRGYDEKSVKLVINFDLPVKIGRDGIPIPNYETYLHRIGRTGRFGTRGIGVNLCCGRRDMEILKAIERYYNTKIEKMKSLEELIDELKKFYLEEN